MKVVWVVTKFVISIVIVGAIGYVLFLQATPLFAKPCSVPIVYEVTGYDERFNISEVEFEEALGEAAELWNSALGKELITEGVGGLEVRMVYGDVQATSELGADISSEQAGYDAKRDQIENLKEEFTVAKRRYNLVASAFEEAKDAYEEKVAYWNARGGAPEDEYKKLQAESARLEEQATSINEQVAGLNALAGELNKRVEEFNALVQTLNMRVEEYNENADTEFDQGRYERDEKGERITIYEFTDRTELVRVLAHEFGHALGLGHIENPDSIMFSYNIGTDRALTEEDILELKRVCRLE